MAKNTEEEFSESEYFEDEFDDEEIPVLNVDDEPIKIGNVITLSNVSDFITLYNTKTKMHTLPPSISHLNRIVSMLRDISNENNKEYNKLHGDIIIEESAQPVIMYFAVKALPAAITNFYLTGLKKFVIGANNSIRSALTSCYRIMDNSNSYSSTVILFVVRLMTYLCSALMRNTATATTVDTSRKPGWVKKFITMTIKVCINRIFSFKLDQIAKPKIEKDDENKENEKSSLSATLACARYLETITRDKEDLYPISFRYNLIKNVTIEFFKIYGKQTVQNYPSYALIRGLILSIVSNAKSDALTIALTGAIRSLASHIRYIFSGKGQPFMIQSRKKGNKNDDAEEKRKKKEKKIEAQTQESTMFRNLFSWSFITAIEFWSEITSTIYVNTENKETASLLFPIVEMIINIVSATPNALRFIPGKLRLIESLYEISNKTSLFIPLYRQCCLIITEALKPSSSSKTDVAVQKWRSKIFSTENTGYLSFKFIMIAPKELTESLIYRRTVIRNSISIMAKFLQNEAIIRPESYPETTIKGNVYISHLLKAIKGMENYPGTEYIIKSCPKYLLNLQKSSTEILKAIKTASNDFSQKIIETRRLMAVCPNDFFVYKRKNGKKAFSLLNTEIDLNNLDENSNRVIPFIKAIDFKNSSLAEVCKQNINIEKQSTTVNTDEDNEKEDFAIDDKLFAENKEWENWSSDSEDDDETDSEQKDGEEENEEEEGEIEYKKNMSAKEAIEKFAADEIAELELSDDNESNKN